MTGNTWLCLTLADYDNIIPAEVASYYEVAESTTWRQLNDTVLTQRFKLQRGPFTIEGIQAMFVNLDVDFTTAMATAITGLQTAAPFGYLLTEAQVRTYTVPQWYVGTLPQVVAYNNQVTTAQGYTAGTNKWADPIENASNAGQWAIPKNASYEDASMTLIQGELPAGWFPDIENP